jgi:hypothetical protein
MIIGLFRGPERTKDGNKGSEWILKDSTLWLYFTFHRNIETTMSIDGLQAK